MNVCMVGHGMMGEWHSQSLAAAGAVPHTLVGRRAEPTSAFAARHGYRRWTLDLAKALADSEVEIVVLTTPSAEHEEQAIRCLEAGKHTLIEIPIAMSLSGAERVVAAGERSGRVYGLSHPMRFPPHMAELLDRVRAGDERIRHIAGRFFINRLENVGATGYRRSWTDNLLWHHLCHFVDLGLYLLDGAPIRQVQSHYGPCHPRTGIPMECVVLVETEDDRSLLVHGSYHAAFRIYDHLMVTDRDSYLTDILAGTCRSRAGAVPTEPEQANAARILVDFMDAVHSGRPPLANGPSVLPAMAVLQQVQDNWDRLHGATTIPGRPWSGVSSSDALAATNLVRGRSLLASKQTTRHSGADAETSGGG
jgi:2-hydroxy-4-carboxymuconate semialdehyde hemiacetal dehydrogenase